MKVEFVKKMVLLVVGLTLGCGVTFAQSGDPNSSASHRTRQGHANGKWMQEIGEKLNLTADQKTAIKSIFTTSASEVKAIRQDKSLSTEQKQAKIKTLRQNVKEQIKAILTPQQQTQLAQLRKQAGHKRG